ncbi:MAG: F0F1 ATP synthase subunit delta [Aestuariivirga sp.]
MKIDWWTVGLQAVNVLILVGLLYHFFWRPVAQIIEKRRKQAQNFLDEAKAKRDEAQAAMLEIDKTRAGFAKERDGILATAKAEAEKAKVTARVSAKDDAEALRSKAQVEIAQDAASAKKAKANQAVALAIQIASRLVARLDGPAVETAFLTWLVEGIKNMSPEARHAVGGKDVTLNLMSAAPLKSPQRAKISKTIATAFGSKPKITFVVDPTLIAGFEIHSPHFILSNSWKADLARIGKDLRNES